MRRWRLAKGVAVFGGLALALERTGVMKESESVLAAIRAVNPAFARTYPKLPTRTPGKI